MAAARTTRRLKPGDKVIIYEDGKQKFAYTADGRCVVAIEQSPEKNPVDLDESKTELHN